MPKIPPPELHPRNNCSPNYCQLLYTPSYEVMAKARSRVTYVLTIEDKGVLNRARSSHV